MQNPAQKILASKGSGHTLRVCRKRLYSAYINYIFHSRWSVHPNTDTVDCETTSGGWAGKLAAAAKNCN